MVDTLLCINVSGGSLGRCGTPDYQYLLNKLLEYNTVILRLTSTYVNSKLRNFSHTHCVVQQLPLSTRHSAVPTQRINQEKFFRIGKQFLLL